MPAHLMYKVVLFTVVALTLSVSWQDGNTDLVVASMNGHADIALLLIHHGAKVNVRDRNGKHALIIATERNHLNVVKNLRAFGADVNITDCDGNTALMIASKSNYVDIVKYLIDGTNFHKGAAVNLKNKEGLTALQMAREKNIFLRSGNPNVQNQNDGIYDSVIKSLIAAGGV
eukprot:GHVR01011617.1.p1 GENE.GHVR01011617.1~~GHVR01011617.1.p1  ORF type:complete len:173 (+),score=15.76 GHVR01011617.1:469-987(+)